VNQSASCARPLGYPHHRGVGYGSRPQRAPTHRCTSDRSAGWPAQPPPATSQDTRRWSWPLRLCIPDRSGCTCPVRYDSQRPIV